MFSVLLQKYPKGKQPSHVIEGPDVLFIFKPQIIVSLFFFEDRNCLTDLNPEIVSRADPCSCFEIEIGCFCLFVFLVLIFICLFSDG